jgi:hypothetical protein
MVSGVAFLEVRREVVFFLLPDFLVLSDRREAEDVAFV